MNLTKNTTTCNMEEKKSSAAWKSEVQRLSTVATSICDLQMNKKTILVEMDDHKLNN